jgi:hypothetical protein
MVSTIIEVVPHDLAAIIDCLGGGYICSWDVEGGEDIVLIQKAMLLLIAIEPYNLAMVVDWSVRESCPRIWTCNLAKWLTAHRCQRITSVTWMRRDGGMVRPSAWAVLRLITNSNVVACSTGKSAGLAPFRILST